MNKEIKALAKRLRAALYELPDTIGTALGGDVAWRRAVLAGKKLEMSRSYYYRALEVALLIIDGRRISLEMLDGDVSLDTFIVNSETIFEAYLRQVLQSAAPEGLIVRGGNVEGKKRLFDDTRVHEAEPDIVVIKRDTGRKVIADVKYKDKPNRDDINQAIVYAHFYRCNHVIPVHLNRHGAPTGPKHIGKMKGVTFQSYAFDLGATALEIEEEAFARYVFDLLPADPGA